MWTTENRSRYDRSRLRYPGALTDEEWALLRTLTSPAKRGGNKRTVDGREIVNRLMVIPSTGCSWALLPKDLPPRSTVNSLPKRWIVERTIDGLHRCRRLAKDWERLNRNAFAFLRWTSIRLMLRSFVRIEFDRGWFLKRTAASSSSRLQFSVVPALSPWASIHNRYALPSFAAGSRSVARVSRPASSSARARNFVSSRLRGAWARWQASRGSLVAKLTYELDPDAVQWSPRSR